MSFVHHCCGPAFAWLPPPSFIHHCPAGQAPVTAPPVHVAEAPDTAAQRHARRHGMRPCPNLRPRDRDQIPRHASLAPWSLCCRQFVGASRVTVTPICCNRCYGYIWSKKRPAVILGGRSSQQPASSRHHTRTRSRYWCSRHRINKVWVPTSVFAKKTGRQLLCWSCHDQPSFATNSMHRRGVGSMCARQP
jgi:hypothetical protein